MYLSVRCVKSVSLWPFFSASNVAFEGLQHYHLFKPELMKRKEGQTSDQRERKKDINPKFADRWVDLRRAESIQLGCVVLQIFSVCRSAVLFLFLAFKIKTEINIISKYNIYVLCVCSDLYTSKGFILPLNPPITLKTYFFN